MIEELSANASLMMVAVLIPLFGALLLPFFSRQPNLREAVSLTTALALVFVVVQLLDVFYTGGRPYAEVWQVIPQFSIAFVLRPLGMIFALVGSVLWFVTTLYAIGYMRGNDEGGQTKFFVCFAVAIAATMGVAFSANLFTMFIFYEALSLSTYPLVTHKDSKDAMLGGRTYLGVLMGGSIGLFLPAILIIWYTTGTLAFARGGITQGHFSPLETGLLLAMFVFGIAKGALMPMHRWLPAAMVAPTPVSALLHAVAVVKAGVFSIVMVIVYVFGFESLAELNVQDWRAASWLPYVASFTIVVSSLIALRQDNLKRRLAYSTIGQLSYIILGAALLTPLSLVGGVMHIVAHAFGKITLFFAAGAIYTASHKTNVSQLNGIGRAMPWTMGAFALGSLCMIGVPPTVGFIGKWYLLLGTMDSENYVALAALIISTFLNAAYLLPIVYAAFFKKPDAPLGHGEAPKTMVWALSFTGFGTLVLFFYSDWLLRIASDIPSLWEPLHLL